MIALTVDRRRKGRVEDINAIRIENYLAGLIVYCCDRANRNVRTHARDANCRRPRLKLLESMHDFNRPYLMSQVLGDARLLSAGLL